MKDARGAPFASRALPLDIKIRLHRVRLTKTNPIGDAFGLWLERNVIVKL